MGWPKARTAPTFSPEAPTVGVKFFSVMLSFVLHDAEKIDWRKGNAPVVYMVTKRFKLRRGRLNVLNSVVQCVELDCAKGCASLRGDVLPLAICPLTLNSICMPPSAR